ncbi:MAG: hypothetical protein QOE70_3687 [Chthoniobacter sp.]|jgi:asparagine synthase (glutamine-hydrolysing)|nr:hypothetical protein [Chthoniobacter sp.]
MCGIFGFVNPRVQQSDYACELLRHRGPDAAGHWTDDKIVLEHTRLSILDLSPGGNQPFAATPGKILTYNGEIFNFADLRSSLEADFSFRTHSDTEVLYYAFQKWGVACLPRLNGMFAFGYYDQAQQKLWLVRDRFGVKPLYYAETPEGLVFASEQKAIYPYLEAEVNAAALQEYFAFKYVSGSRTLVKGVLELDPGAYLEIDLTTMVIRKTQWYQLPRERSGSSQGLTERTEALLQDAIRLRLISDVPLGVQLSGGVDSSLITHLVSRLLPERVNTYSINCINSSYDEGGYAQDIADRCGVTHHPIDFTADDFLRDWESAVFHNDEPLNHPHSLPIMRLTEVARSDVTVLLSGEGADETFAGYPHARRFLSAEDPSCYLELGRFNDSANLGEMLAEGPLSEAAQAGERLALIAGSEPNETGYPSYEFRTHLNTLLNRVDKMSMAHAMEIRTPYLDYRLVEVGLKTPLVALMGQQQETRKKPLLELYERYFHNGLSTRDKIGFRVPLDEWIRGRPAFRTFIQARLEVLRQDSIFRPGYVDGLIAGLGADAISDARLRQIWTVANYAIWRLQFPQIS